MKKVLVGIISIFILFITNNVFSESWNLLSSWAIENSWSLIKPQLIEENWTVIKDNVSVEDMSYIYYYWQWCAHCANVDRYMKWVDWYDKLDIIKKEIYFDDDNRSSYLADWKRLWFAEENLGVPFLIANDWSKETAFFGDTPIIEHFTGFLWEPEETASKWFILLIVWIFLLALPFVLLSLSNKK